MRDETWARHGIPCPFRVKGRRIGCKIGSSGSAGECVLVLPSIGGYIRLEFRVYAANKEMRQGSLKAEL